MSAMLRNWLCKNPANEAWIAKQEEKHRDQLENDKRLSLIRKEMYPALTLAQVEQVVPEAQRSEIAEEIVQRCLMKKRFQDVLKELVDYFRKRNGQAPSEKVRKTSDRYHTETWANKSLALFFYWHPQMGNQDMAVTCTVWPLNKSTFNNWITQKTYYPKWASFVKSMTALDVKAIISLCYAAKFEHVPDDSKVDLPTKYFAYDDGKSYLVSKGGATSRQKKQKIASLSTSVIYIPDYARSVGDSGKKVKYKEQEDFVIQKIRSGWETGNPLTRSACYSLLIHELVM